MKKKLMSVAVAVAMALGAANTASALTAGTISTAAGNDGVAPIYGTASRAGWFGANWYLVGGPATIYVSYLGNEAGFSNSFNFGGGASEFTTGADGFAIPVGGPIPFANVASGLLNFSFTSPLGTVVNGSNTDNRREEVHGARQIVACATCTSGTAVDLWLDDLGAGDDDNHDDMVIRLSLDGGRFQQVPIPAALPLLLSGLAGLGFVGRRRKVA